MSACGIETKAAAEQSFSLSVIGFVYRNTESRDKSHHNCSKPKMSLLSCFNCEKPKDT